ncbi:MAG: hypothetical protein OXF89_16885 [Rhodospirillaceae bacterium]|nr:hypothetical protein [Rhodospirillaceae bacterium]MCY4067234.1 hypothetical protein [Rhodospirillaceae bacterium]
MTEAIAFDTHRFVKRLTESGFTERQAETLAEEHVALLNANLATKVDVAALKTDIVQVEASLKTDIAQVEATLKADIAQVGARIEAVKADLLKWMFGALIAQGGLIVALVKLL